MNGAFSSMLARLAAVVGRPKSEERGLTPAAVAELCRKLEAEKHALENFTASLEEEFLRLGGLLRRITLLTRDVRSRSGEIVAATAGQAEDAAIQFAFHLLKKAEDLVRASREQYESVFTVFEKIHEDLTRIARERARLVQTLSPLESTNTQFRIQACYFDEETRLRFFALADTIQSIVGDVRTAVEQRFEELANTGQSTEQLARKLTALAAELSTDTERMLAETRTHLSALHEVLQGSERAAQSISDAGATIAGGVGRTIVALQCQDMARQKFQHIGAAIEEMIRHLPSGEGERFTSAQETECRDFLAAAGRVQLGQLRAVFCQLTEAAQQVQTGVVDVQEVSRVLVGQAMQSGRTALDGQVIQSAIRSIQAVLGVIENAVGSIAGVVGLVTRLKSTFSDCTTQILGLALRLRLVALNAQVFAAHVEEGASLEVVARNTRLIADESMQQLDEISSRVNGLVEAVADLEERMVDYSAVAAEEQQQLTHEAGESQKKLHMLDRDLRTAMEAMGPMEQELAHAIRLLIESIRFPGAVAEASGRSTALFETIAGLSAGDESQAHPVVEELQRNYTMAHEREIHDAAVNNRAAAAEDEEQLADNIELF